MVRRVIRSAKRRLKSAIRRLAHWILDDDDEPLVRPRDREPQRRDPEPASPPVAPPADEDAAAEAELDAVVEQVIAEAEAAAAQVADLEPPPTTPVTVFGEATPNPNAMKFTATVPVLAQGTLSFTSPEQAAGHPLGAALFALDGVKVVFAVNDFVTVTKQGGADWGVLAPQVEAVLADVLTRAGGPFGRP